MKTTSSLINLERGMAKINIDVKKANIKKNNSSLVHKSSIRGIMENSKGYIQLDSSVKRKIPYIAIQ